MGHDEQRNKLKQIIENFVKEAIKDVETISGIIENDYKCTYLGCDASAGFGHGNKDTVPSYSFLNYDQKKENGIYPCLLVYRKYGYQDSQWIDNRQPQMSFPLVVAYGVSAKNKTSKTWSISNVDSIKEISKIKTIKYKNSFVKKVFSVSENDIPVDDIIQELDEVINTYDEIFKETMGGNAPTLMIGETDIVAFLRANQNIILHGAPGTGKTFLAKEIAKKMCNITSDEELKDSIQFKMVQFHPSYDYTDFVEGLRPKGTDNNGNIIFARQDGVFKKFCKEAVKTKDKYFIFVIDEINRGDMSKIFGDLFYAIDPGYRGEKGKIDTQYQNLILKEGDKNFDENNADPFRNGFYVPENVFIIGTMNDIDRSVESMDFAMRRRFQFIEVTAEDRAYGMGLKKDENTKADYKTKDAYARMTNLNNCIISKEIGLSKAYQIGGSYFLSNEKDANGNRIPIKDNFDALWKYRLEGLLREYLRGEEDKVIEEKLENILKPAFNLHDGHSYNTKGEKVKNTESVIPENTTTDE